MIGGVNPVTMLVSQFENLLLSFRTFLLSIYFSRKVLWIFESKSFSESANLIETVITGLFWSSETVWILKVKRLSGWNLVSSIVQKLKFVVLGSKYKCVVKLSDRSAQRTSFSTNSYPYPHVREYSTFSLWVDSNVVDWAIYAKFSNQRCCPYS